MGRKKQNKIYSKFAYDEGIKRSKCLEEGCNQFIKGNHGANLLRHFYTQHRGSYNEIIALNSSDKENRLLQPSDNQKSVIENCTQLVTVHGRPFSIVEDKAFQNILKLIPFPQSERQAINIKNIRSNVESKAHELRQSIFMDIQNSLLALKIDVASIKLRRFLGLNIQYFANGKINLRNLSVTELHNRNTGSYLKDTVSFILSRYGIELKQIHTITTDNGSNMLSMTNLMSEDLSILLSVNESFDYTEDQLENEQSEIELNLDPEEHNIQLEIEDHLDDSIIFKVVGVRCAAHCLQLAVRDASKDIESTLELCRRIMRNLRTPNMALQLREGKLPQAVIDTTTRWDSTIDMLECIIKLKDFCVANLQQDLAPQFLWPLVESILNSLIPCRILSKKLQTDKLTFGDFCIAWIKCRLQVEQINEPFAQNLVRCMNYRQQLLFENDCFIAAAYLDPRINSILTNEQLIKARTYLIMIYKRIIQLEPPNRSGHDHEPVPGPSGAQSQSSSSYSIDIDSYFCDLYTQNRQTAAPNSISIESELTFKLVTFLSQPLLPTEANIVEYWESKKNIEPQLYMLAKVVLATPPTSVSVERLFSSLKYVVNNLRLSLNDSIIEDIMLIRNNFIFDEK